MTILILNVRIPLPYEVPKPEDLLPVIVTLSHHLRTFAVSFLIVGSTWDMHHQLFARIKHANRPHSVLSRAAGQFRPE